MEKERRLGPAISATLIALTTGACLSVTWHSAAPRSAILTTVTWSVATQAVTWLVMFYAPYFLNRDREAGFRRSMSFYDTAWVTLTALLCVTQACLVAKIRGFGVSMPSLHAFSLGILFVVLGNTLGKLSPNGVIGIRTPWTRRSVWVWDRTHRTCGPLMVLLGTAFLVMGLLARPSQILQIALVLSFAALAYGISWYYGRIEARRS
ncbi:SdpI family protein [Brytella acorum]|uniref:SdpI family protein n=1 Tax=Brytella acorum TaxID=2959299 RepID=A0AA35UGY9_9PROT|nr:SdpI family protein [Brytella acorum]MDF3625013.1 SdpI family protein [Brytella acorum]CAI9121109.1 SdpI family protein [Brytella acorum]